MKNNAHKNESAENRLTRFEKGTPIESIETLLNSINNFFNNEIAITPKKYQTSLLFLGIHSVALTISEVFWNKNGKDGYKKFLESFVDGNTPDTKFSSIAPKIHNWRNVLAHQWIASTGHQISYDYNMPFGFKNKNNILIINPAIYCKLYINAFSGDGKIWEHTKIFNSLELEDIKKRIITKFKEN